LKYRNFHLTEGHSSKEPYRSYLNEAAMPVFQGKRRAKRTFRGNIFPLKDSFFPETRRRVETIQSGYTATERNRPEVFLDLSIKIRVTGHTVPLKSARKDCMARSLLYLLELSFLSFPKRVYIASCVPVRDTRIEIPTLYPIPFISPT